MICKGSDLISQTTEKGMEIDLPEEELDINISQDQAGCFIARIFHKPSATIKISDRYGTEQEALENALQGLKELIAEKRKGLGAQ